MKTSAPSASAKALDQTVPGELVQVSSRFITGLGIVLSTRDRVTTIGFVSSNISTFPIAEMVESHELCASYGTDWFLQTPDEASGWSNDHAERFRPGSLIEIQGRKIVLFKATSVEHNDLWFDLEANAYTNPPPQGGKTMNFPFWKIWISEEASKQEDMKPLAAVTPVALQPK